MHCSTLCISPCCSKIAPYGFSNDKGELFSSFCLQDFISFRVGIFDGIFFFTAVLRNLRHHAKCLQERWFGVKTPQGSREVRGEVSLLSTGQLPSWWEWCPLASGTKSDPAGGPQLRAWSQTLLDVFSADSHCLVGKQVHMFWRMPCLELHIPPKSSDLSFLFIALHLDSEQFWAAAAPSQFEPAIGTDWAVKARNRKSFENASMGGSYLLVWWVKERACFLGLFIQCFHQFYTYCVFYQFQHIHINTLLATNHSYFQPLWCCGSKSPVYKLEIATMVWVCITKVKSRLAQQGQMWLILLTQALYRAQLSYDVCWEAALRHLPRVHHRQKTGKCANQITKRIAQITDLPADKKAAELMATYKLKPQPS